MKLPAACPGANKNCTTNWAGWEADRTKASQPTFADVSATFTAPSIVCKKAETSRLSQWVGLGGTGTDPLYQAGLETVCNLGVVSYHTFYAVSGGPDATRQVILDNQLSGQIKAGDPVGMYMNWLARNGFYFRTQDNNLRYPSGPSGKANFPGTFPAPNSAECVVSRPQYANGTFDNLSNFGTTKFDCNMEATGPATVDHDLSTGVATNYSTGAVVNSPIPWSVTNVNMINKAGGHRLATTAAANKKTLASVSFVAAS